MLKLEIVTPEKKVFDSEVDSVTVPTATGEVGILPQHAPVVSALKPGVLSAAIGGVVEKVAIGGGFLEVSRDRVAVLTDSAVTKDEVDAAAMRAEREAAEHELAEHALDPVDQTDLFRERLDAANARLTLAGGK